MVADALASMGQSVLPIEEGQLDFRRREATPSPRRWERNLPGCNGVGARAGGSDGRYHAPPSRVQGRVEGGGGGAFSVKNGASIHAHVESSTGRTQTQFHRSIDFMTCTGEPTTSV
jgi:hypothetical protein